MSDMDEGVVIEGEELDPGTALAGDSGDAEETLLFSPGIELSQEMQEEILQYLIQEVDLVSTAREARENSWETWRRHREARPESPVVNFPWDGASNLVPGVAASNTNGVYSHVRRAFLKRAPLWTVEATHTDEARRMKSFTRFLNSFVEDPSKANVKRPLKTALYDAISLADQFVEVPWVERRIKFKRPELDGTTQDVDRIIYSGPVFLPHRIDNVYARLEIEDLQETPFIAIRHDSFTKGKIQSLARDGFFGNIEEVVTASQSQFDDNKELSLGREGIDIVESTDEPLISLWKAWVYWDIDGDGVPEDVIIWYHAETETIIRAELNDFGFRLITNMRYFPIPYSLYSMGVGSMAEHTQEEITTLHNMRINSLNIHSLQMMVTKRGTNLGKREKFYPLKNITVDNPREDLQVLTFPDVSSSTLEAEMQAKRYLDLYTGVSEAMLGMPDQTAKSGTSPSLQMFLAQQGNAILETAIESLADALSEIGFFFVLQLVKNSDSLMPYLEDLVDSEDLEDVRSVLELNIEDIPLHLRMAVKTTEVQKSEDAKRQNLMALNQLYTMYAQEVMQYMQVMMSPEVPEPMKEFAMRIYLGKTRVMEETLELFGTEQRSDFVPYVRDVEMLLSMIDEQKKMVTETMSQQMGGMNGTEAGAGVGMGQPLGGSPPPMEGQPGGGGAPLEPGGGDPNQEGLI